MLYKDIVISLYVVFVQRAALSQLARSYFIPLLTVYYSRSSRLLSCGFVFVVLSISRLCVDVNTFLLVAATPLFFGSYAGCRPDYVSDFAYFTRKFYCLTLLTFVFGAAALYDLIHFKSKILYYFANTMTQL